MKYIRYFAALLCVSGFLAAKTKEFTVSGGTKIKAAFERGMPLPAERAGIRIEAAAFMFGGGKLTFAFGFTTKEKLRKVVVENVTGSQAVTLVEDSAPVVEKDFWKGEAAPLPISKNTLPWLYERGDTTMVFRFTVTLEGQAQPVVLYQPSVYASAVKQQLVKRSAP